ncbi:MAG: hypothetical protein CMM93_05740 [Rickettsiales bacterium]|nr:hypothetical protein [Rickettsiales bacterium]
MRSKALKTKHFGQAKDRITLDIACGKYLLEHAQFLKSYKTVRTHCAHLIAHFGGGKYLDAIGNKEINGYVSARRVLVNEDGRRLVSDTTINREMETFRKIFHLARDKWEAQIGAINFREHRLRQPEARTRWITSDEAETLIEKAADHLKPVIRFALLTGVRLSNITGLKWSDVDLKHREIRFRIKSNIPGGKLLELPITDELADLLEGLRGRPQYRKRRMIKDATGKPMIYTVNQSDYVFTFRGEPIQDSFKKAFRTACTAAKIEDFRFHDLRHTAASWMIQRGVPIDLVQEILGHTQITTTKKYAHRDKTEKLNAMRRMTLQQTEHTNLTNLKVGGG